MNDLASILWRTTELGVAFLVPLGVAVAAKVVRVRTMADVIRPSSQTWSNSVLTAEGVSSSCIGDVQKKLRSSHKDVAERVAYDCHNVAPGLAATYGSLLVSLGLASIVLHHGGLWWWLVWTVVTLMAVLVAVLYYRHDLCSQGRMSMAYDPHTMRFVPTFSSRSTQVKHYLFLASACLPGAAWVLLVWKFGQ